VPGHQHRECLECPGEDPPERDAVQCSARGPELPEPAEPTADRAEPGQGPQAALRATPGRDEKPRRVPAQPELREPQRA
jgi:hypothetical protein